ncbi:heme-binding protein [Zafaria sp. Z1313]|uniref:heme-binding protein n=1 Tax=unclassified Zafaria TaxID=2828765 RepID=UPI003D302C60
MDFAVVDAGVNLKAHVRTDCANIGVILISVNKAYTAIAFHCETGDLQLATRLDGPIYGLNDAPGGRLW